MTTITVDVFKGSKCER